jgi:hypothetical protein
VARTVLIGGPAGAAPVDKDRPGTSQTASGQPGSGQRRSDRSCGGRSCDLRDDQRPDREHQAREDRSLGDQARDDQGARDWPASTLLNSPLDGERAAVVLEYASRLIDQGCTPVQYSQAIRALPDYGYVLRDRDRDLRTLGFPGEEQGMQATCGGPWPPEEAFLPGDVPVGPGNPGDARDPDTRNARADEKAPPGPEVLAPQAHPRDDSSQLRDLPSQLRDRPSQLEIPLLGGDMTDGVVRVGRTVRRPARPHTPAVHALLRHLEAVGFTGAPRVLGIDAQNREVLTYLPGEVPHRPLPAYAVSEATLTRLAELQLRYHQAVVGFEPPPGAQWDGEVTPLVDGPPELVCHCDINLENVIFRPGPDGPEPYALIDFDLARPGTRLVDIIQTLRYWAPLAAPPDRDPAFADVDVPGRIALFCHAYGLSYAERARLVPVALQWLRRSRITIADRARRRGGAWTRMLEVGVGERLLRAAAWMEASRPEIDARLRRPRLRRPSAPA